MTMPDGKGARFGADTGGAIAVMTALLLPVLLGIAAYAVDASLLFYRQERLQIAADIGARAGAEMLVRGESGTRATAFAETIVAANMDAGATPAVAVTLPEPGRLSVEASLPVPRIFSQIFGSGDVIVRAGSVAVYEMAAEPDACIYLREGTKKALSLDRDSSLAMTGCGIAVASSHPNAVDFKRGATLLAGCLNVAGGISNPDAVTLDACAAPRLDEPVGIPDAFADLPAPPHKEGACTEYGKDGPPEEIFPGGRHSSGKAAIWLCDGLEITRDTIGRPGLYFIWDELKIDDDATLDLGPSAVIVLMEDATIEIDEGSRLRVAAPLAGPFEGIAIMGGEGWRVKKALDLDIGRLEATGMLIFPDADVAIIGSDLDAGCLRIYARTLTLENGAALEGGCAGGGGTEGGTVSLAPAP
ncbi:pilus assembly protein TadG-related protein [Meridianimarinicoccus sp. RP-17]|uniref:TadE/TadG family type IV pilus assembly protein n=1 Tax=Meridianimarinicoccus zhengii TaxID=2056810 RepID=UPI000DAEB193|nr:TadE/TadG family type IV pilus assembly protein [Phycocomes zhengii]